MLTFAVSDQWRQNHDAAALRYFPDGIHDLLHCLTRDFPAAFRAMGMTDASKKKAQVIIGFGQRAYGRPGIMGRSLLVEGYGRAKAFNVIDVRFLHLPQKLTGIGGKGLYVAALPLGIYGIESQRAFPRAGNTGDNHQFVPGDNDVYIFEVVL